MISVIAYRSIDFPLLRAQLTVARVIQHLVRLPISKVERYELARLGALNFVLEGALPGGVTRSLVLDTHGKTLSSCLLLLELDGPEETKMV